MIAVDTLVLLHRGYRPPTMGLEWVVEHPADAYGLEFSIGGERRTVTFTTEPTCKVDIVAPDEPPPMLASHIAISPRTGVITVIVEGRTTYTGPPDKALALLAKANTPLLVDRYVVGPRRGALWPRYMRP